MVVFRTLVLPQSAVATVVYVVQYSRVHTYKEASHLFEPQGSAQEWSIACRPPSAKEWYLHSNQMCSVPLPAISISLSPTQPAYGMGIKHSSVSLFMHMCKHVECWLGMELLPVASSLITLTGCLNQEGSHLSMTFTTCWTLTVILRKEMRRYNK